jgi:hypothetical protein
MNIASFIISETEHISSNNFFLFGFRRMQNRGLFSDAVQGACRNIHIDFRSLSVYNCVAEPHHVDAAPVSATEMMQLLAATALALAPQHWFIRSKTNAVKYFISGTAAPYLKICQPLGLFFIV